MTAQDLHYLRSILRHLREVQAFIAEDGPSAGSKALADNIDWLNCFIEAAERIPSHDQTDDGTGAPAMSESSFPLHPSERRETEIQRLVREIGERQARLSELVLGDQRKSVTPVSDDQFPPGVDPNWTCSGMENACEQDEGA
jgi:hypothetical protein